MYAYIPKNYLSKRPQVSMGYINNSHHLARKYARIFVRGHYLFREAKSFPKRSSRKTVSYDEQIMSKDKYPSIFSPQMATIVFIILQIFFATHAVLKIGEYSRIFPSLSWGIFGHMTRLDQLRVSKKIWWIIKANKPRAMLAEHEKNLQNTSRRRVVQYEFFECSTTISSGLSAFIQEPNQCARSDWSISCGLLCR